MTAVDGEQPAGQEPAPVPTRTLRFQVTGGLVRPRPAPALAAPDAGPAAGPAAGPGDQDGLPGTVGPVGRLLAATVRLPEPAPPLPSRRHRTPRVPTQRRWYARPLPAAMAVGGLVTVTATGLAEGLAPGSPGSTIGIPAPGGTGSTLRGALLVPPPRLPAARPTPGEVPPRGITPAAPVPPAGSAADSSTGAPPSAGPDRTDRPKRLRKPRRTRTRPASGTGGSATGAGGAATGDPTGDPSGDPTGQVTIGPP